uniref:Uncharacterized protein n=1 Tax=Amphimedon queenslandica TaxID=400682 RepID=A0A1X7TKY7_AMPQE
MIEADIARLLHADTEQQKYESALFIMRLREINRLPQSVIEDVVSSSRSLFSNTFKRLYAGVRQRIAETGHNIDISDIFDELQDPFAGLETAYLQEQYINTEFKVLEPLSIKIGTAYYIDKMFGQKRRKVLHTDSMHYVSLCDTLQMLLENEDFASHLTFEAQNNAKHYSDFSDGSFYQNHSVYKANINSCLQIIAYYDELELCNPLGTNVKKHKIGCIFFTIGNLHPKYRSSFKSIFLSTAVNYSIVERHGMNEVLKPFVEELNKLALSGIEVLRNGTKKMYKGALVGFLADNLASHTVGGFKQSMSFARHFCRSCMATKDESRKHFTAEKFKSRTPEEHEVMCTEIISDTTGEKSTNYGINERSILNDVIGFSVIGGLCHDIMHDMLEGALPYELRLLLQHLFNAGHLKLQEYNDRVKAFDYGYTETANKPNEIPIRCFQDKVLIEEHHSLFVELYPNESFIPKLHYLIHYPKQIEEQGPMVRAWTMRYEGKLKYFKGISRSGNFKNITYTLAKRHQKWLAYHLQTRSMFTPECTRGPILSTVSLSEESDDIQSLIKQNMDIPDSDISSCTVVTLKWIMINGVKYSNQNCHLVTNVSNGEPEFSKVEKVISISLKGRIYLVVSKCTIASYSEHLMAYAFKPTETLDIVCSSNLAHPSPLHQRKPFFSNDSQLYLSPPFFII